MANEVWDISPYISVSSPVWPGDTVFTQTPVWTLSEDCPVNVAKFTMSAHTGAHADAPRHYDRDGLCIGDVSLEYYLGACTVVDVRSITQKTIDLSSIKSLLPSRLAPRVLFRTYERAPQTAWDSHFKAVSAELIEFLANQGVKLIGTDTPSLDPQDSKTMDAHQMIAKHKMAILEGLVLDNVSAGDYELIALPLKLKHLDASPVRAVLRELI